MKLDEIKELARIFGKSKLSKMKIKMDDFELEMEKGVTTAAPAPAPVSAAAPVAQAAQAAAAEESASTEAAAQKASQAVAGEIIASPMVGTFYAAPSPDAAPFVKVGDRVKKGQPLCILEAMKIMNELEAEYDCKILDILVQDGEAVEYDKPLFVVEKI